MLDSHLGLVKRGVTVGENTIEFCSLLDIPKIQWEDLIKDNNFQPYSIKNPWTQKTHLDSGGESWDKDTQYITQEFYDRYFPSILEYYRNNIMTKKGSRP